MKNPSKRRNFIKQVTAAGLLPLFGTQTLAGAGASSLPVANQSNTDDLEISKLEFIRLKAQSGKQSIYVTATLKNGIEGLYGPIDWDSALLADKMLKDKVIGRNALEHEAIWNRLFESNRHSRGSHFLMGISTIDNLLWDLKGKIFNQPVYKILGGDRHQVQVYGSCLGFSQEPWLLIFMKVFQNRAQMII